jgi:hypothetical protein
MTLRQACSIAYAMHVEGMSGEQIGNFKFALYEEQADRAARERRDSLAARSRGLGAPVIIKDSSHAG